MIAYFIRRLISHGSMTSVRKLRRSITLAIALSSNFFKFVKKRMLFASTAVYKHRCLLSGKRANTARACVSSFRKSYHSITSSRFKRFKAPVRASLSRVLAFSKLPNNGFLRNLLIKLNDTQLHSLLTLKRRYLLNKNHTRFLALTTFRGAGIGFKPFRISSERLFSQLSFFASFLWNSRPAISRYRQYNLTGGFLNALTANTTARHDFFMHYYAHSNALTKISFVGS